MNSALISRSRVVELHSLADEDVADLVRRALEDERGLDGRCVLEDAALEAIVMLAGATGAGRSSLELAAGASARARGKRLLPSRKPMFARRPPSQSSLR